jgi:tetratricopeptide (TPR) repeat protein
MTSSGLWAGMLLLWLGTAAPALAYGTPANVDIKANLEGRDVATFQQARQAVEFKDWDTAIALLTDLTLHNDRSADLENMLGYSYRMRGRYAEAFAHYDKALTLDPTHRGALEYEGEAYLETNQLPKAERHLSTLRAACGAQNCQEYALLKGAIDRYKSKASIN